MYKYKETIESLLKEVNYNEEDGNFYWINPKQGRPTDRPAGSTNHKGYTQIKYNGILFSISKIIWYLKTGEVPPQSVGYKDNNPHNTRWDNLKLVSELERTLNFRNATTAPEVKPPVMQRKLRRPTFSSQEVHAAVEDFIKNKTLVNGRYVDVGNQHTEASMQSRVPHPEPRQD